ncbi:hypothetical protein [Lactiplantibacillus paraplantarum]|uniref:Uncharacterized protein n=1 Tax=Lactiplantibacillus paraplantarum TaxID=60520 RepID=A0AAD0X6R4_9LACO|nr:hypothetical protein [Lactiplantibacillus paraplantarum]AYJ38903.1 hypothetical protein LP667_08775 [Lactiplantibacillus paraplantarum]AYJ38957.1 hypothetical protein LP667_09070 [Lactiplantibacillus paraplantarum]MCU4684000.1 hypothetical protein [Lactiplantibacillus paraplantarum]MDL2061065.1 hypothetical protein [Lactiplantibacillus paraplantarum]QJU52036.1 hypothetical protein CK401_03011 [Lactiplantibacillus paraplantarum]
MYDESINYALSMRRHNTIRANEETLLTDIQFAVGCNVIERNSTKKYSEEFLEALGDNGVIVVTPEQKADKWIFRLPDEEGNYDNY